jgi:hypothetical protein
LLEDNSDDRLRTYVIFMPMLDGDTDEAAYERAQEFRDDRVTYFWDYRFVSGTAWREAYDLDHTAWDVYLLYGAGTTWTSAPTQADFGMTNHRAIADLIPKLRIELFAAEAKRLLGNMD